MTTTLDDIDRMITKYSATVEADYQLLRWMNKLLLTPEQMLLAMDAAFENAHDCRMLDAPIHVERWAAIGRVLMERYFRHPGVDRNGQIRPTGFAAWCEAVKFGPYH